LLQTSVNAPLIVPQYDSKQIMGIPIYMWDQNRILTRLIGDISSSSNLMVYTDSVFVSYETLPWEYLMIFLMDWQQHFQPR
jgi:hypothetical protein